MVTGHRCPAAHPVQGGPSLRGPCSLRYKAPHLASFWVDNSCPRLPDGCYLFSQRTHHFCWEVLLPRDGRVTGDKLLHPDRTWTVTSTLHGVFADVCVLPGRKSS